MEISKEKQDIISVNGHHIKVESGPGAGKSTLLTQFINERVLEGTHPDRILVLMFTKASQLDFSSKLRDIQISNVKVKTIHSYGYSLINELYNFQMVQKHHVGSISDYHLNRWFRQILNQANSEFVNSKYHHINQQTIDGFYTFITLKRNLDFQIENISNFQTLERLSNPVYERAYQLFIQQRDEKGIVPINEVVAIPAEMFALNSHLSTNLKNRYDYLLVDEAQDLSEMDFAMINNHLGINTKIVMVGDSNQSINEFRGANCNIFQNLDKLLENVCVKQLRGSYRFSKGMSDLSRKLFNQEEIDPQFFTQKNTYASIEIERYYDNRNPLIKALRPENKLTDNCLILREKNAFPLYELMLLDNDIPYNLHKNRSFVFHKPIAMLLGYLLVASDLCISMLPLDVQTAIVKGMLFTPYPQAQSEISYWLTGKIPSVAFEMITTLKAKREENNAFGNIPVVANMIKSAFNNQSNVINILEAMLCYKCFDPLFNSNSAKLNQSGLSQVRLLEYFKSTGMTVERLFSLIIKSTKVNNKSNYLNIMTIHDTKGSEFKNVFIGALVDGIFPLIRTEEDKQKSSIDCEKRLFYVAMTRAIKRLTLLCPKEDIPVSNDYVKNNITFVPYKTSQFISLLTM